MAASPLLDIRRVSAGYGKLSVLREVSLRVDEGEIVSIIGPNGAGKSTVLRTAMGYLRPSGGTISFLGEEITGLDVPAVVARGLGYVAQGRVVFPRMTVLENLEVGGYLVRDRGRLHERVERALALFPRLAERRRQLAGTLSGGEQQMLLMGRALMTEPRCLVLDEPSLGLAPRFVDLVFGKIQELRSDGVTVVLVEQNAARALGVSDRGYVLELGRNRVDGKGADLLADEEVRTLFIGG